jgi:hypothetical protein
MADPSVRDRVKPGSGLPNCLHSGHLPGETANGASKNRTCDLGPIRLTTFDYLELTGVIVPGQGMTCTSMDRMGWDGTRDRRGMKYSQLPKACGLGEHDRK